MRGPIICENGAHFCENPVHIIRYYEPLGYNRYFKVKAYGKVVQDEEKVKSCAQIIEFVEEFGFMDFMKMLSDGNNRSDGTSMCYGLLQCEGLIYLYFVTKRMELPIIYSIEKQPSREL